MDNITITEDSAPVQAPEQKEIRLVDIEVTNENMALNLMVSFLNIAQKRGAFNLDEASKVWECVQKFIVKANEATAASTETA